MKVINMRITKNMKNEALGNKYTRSLVFFCFIALTACGGGGSSGDGDKESTEELAALSTANNRVARLNAAATWMYQIQALNQPGATQILAATNYPLLVIEPGDNFALDPYDTPAILDELRTAPDGSERLILAYIDIGEAEDYRDYWQANWVAPTDTKKGSPDFLITEDPDGWSGNYPVAYWRFEWQKLWIGEIGGDGGIIKKLAKMGFDGVYLDWVEGYDDNDVREFAKVDKVGDPDEEMVAFIEKLRAAGQSVTRDFLVVPQNAPYLIDYDIENNTTRYADAIDALAVEDTWYYGEGDEEWDDLKAGDLTGDERQQGDFSTENRLKKYKDYQDRGLPVFSIDYCITSATAQTAYTEARKAGLKPLVSRVSLSRLTETPPKDF